MKSCVCDGGPSEQSALTVLEQEFPNMNLTARDRAHRTRSVMKGIWEPLNNKCAGLLGALVTDQQSFARMVKSLGSNQGFGFCLQFQLQLVIWITSLPFLV